MISLQLRWTLFFGNAIILWDIVSHKSIYYHNFCSDHLGKRFCEVICLTKECAFLLALRWMASYNIVCYLEAYDFRRSCYCKVCSRYSEMYRVRP